jgi:hypothetical protein
VVAAATSCWHSPPSMMRRPAVLVVVSVGEATLHPIFLFLSEMFAQWFLMDVKNVCRALILMNDKGVCCVPDKWRMTKVCLPCEYCQAAFVVRHGGKHTSNSLSCVSSIRQICILQ